MKIIKKLSAMLPRAAAYSQVLTFALINTLALASEPAFAPENAISNQSGFNSEPQAIASTSLCGDGYLFTLLGDNASERISALSWQSRDGLSRAPKTMHALPQAWDDTEHLLALNTDYVLFGTGEGATAQKYLSRTHTKFSNLTWGEDFNSVYKNLNNIGEDIGAQDAARRFIETTKQKLSRLKQDESAKRPKVLYLSRSGGSAGPGTLVDAAITAAGGQNIFERTGWFTPDTEYLISLNPDLIITSYFDDGYESINAVPLRNKTVRKFMSRYPSLDIPGHVWPCAGPYLIEAAQMIHDKLQSLQDMR